MYVPRGRETIAVWPGLAAVQAANDTALKTERRVAGGLMLAAILALAGLNVVMEKGGFTFSHPTAASETP